MSNYILDNYRIRYEWSKSNMLQSFANINVHITVILQSILDTKYCSTTFQFRIEYIFGSTTNFCGHLIMCKPNDGCIVRHIKILTILITSLNGEGQATTLTIQYNDYHFVEWFVYLLKKRFITIKRVLSRTKMNYCLSCYKFAFFVKKKLFSG